MQIEKCDIPTNNKVKTSLGITSNMKQALIEIYVITANKAKTLNLSKYFKTR